ncbi:MAG: hypothetical protein GVY12_02210 [Bacteroidetes bacterium]|jgi:hypothetical protein|nr:hypothetical protein [Bacteroidota bacterium]
MVSPRKRAAEELQILKPLFRYADHQDFRTERFAALTARLDRRLRLMRWVGLATGLAFMVWAVFHFIDYGQAGELQTLVLASLMLLLAVGYAYGTLYLSRHYRTRLAVARALLEVSDERSATDSLTDEAVA